MKSTQAGNKDAFSLNQSVSAMTPPAAEAVASTEDSAKSGALESSDIKDTEMVDAPTESTKPPSPPAEPATEVPVANSIDTAADPADAAAKLSPKQVPSTSAIETSETTETAETVVKPDPEPVASQEKADEAETEKEGATGTINTQSTTATEVRPGDLMTPTNSMSQMALGVSQDSTAEPLTTDTSMTDAPPQSSAKVAREREEDDEEPVAKRARTSGDSEGPAEVARALETAVAPDAMAVDPPEKASTPAPAPTPATVPVSATAPAPESRPAANASPAPLSMNGKALMLTDPSLENNPITVFQNKEIRKVLGQIKKTKAGAQFKQSVQILWPGLWESYRQSIARPVDIMFIEQGLRDGNYANLGEFKKDVYLIEQNAVTFNGMNHDVAQWARTTVKDIFHRLASIHAEEPAKPVKQEPKQLPSRHTDRDRKTVPAPPPKKEARPVASSPADKTNESQTFSLLPSGVPNIRRDSTKTDADRPKRPIHPPKNRDLGFPAKTARNKRKPELRFCEEMLKELMAPKNWSANQWFMEPVDPVALNIPNYHSVVKQPMDLGTMKGKLDHGEYESAKDFKSDFGLIVRNCVKFNTENNPVTATVRELEKLFERKWAEKASWISKHAPPPAPSVSATSPRGGAKDDTDDEDASDAEEQGGPSSEQKDLERALETLNTRLKAESAELDKKLESTDPDFAAIELQRSIVTHLQNTRMEKRIALNRLTGDIKKGPAKGSKKKSTGGGGGSGGTSRKAGGGGQGPSKKASSGGAASARKPIVKKKLSDEEKEIVSEGISRLEDTALEKAITIIKKDTGLKVSMCPLWLLLCVNI